MAATNNFQGGSFDAFLNYSQAESINTVTVLLKPLESEVGFFEPFVAFQEWLRQKANGYEQSTPNVVAKHGALLIYNRVYDFSEKGLRLLNVLDSALFNEHLEAGNTNKSEGEFQRWIMSQGKRYTKTCYRTGSNNCLCFVQNACKFLNVEIPPQLQLIMNWLEKNWGVWEEILDTTQIISEKLSSSPDFTKADERSPSLQQPSARSSREVSSCRTQ